MMTKTAITSFTAILVACAGLGMTAGTALAASLTITPPSVAANYTGTIALDIAGLASGQTVLVETFLDINGNGTIDAGDILVQSFQVTDGQALTIDTVRDTNVPGDEDGLADGKIHTVLNFPALAEANKGVAKFVYRASPATSGFTPVPEAFTITQPVYAQKVVGQVTSGGAAVPYAFTFLTDPAINSEPIVAALADANGNFTLNAASGSYAVVALKAGFVSDFSTPPVVTVNTGATVTQNLTLTTADTIISGRLTDLDSGAGIPGVQTTAKSESGLFALVFSDASGNFVVPVFSASTQWGVNPSEKSLVLSGYLSLQDNQGVDISGGSVSGVSIQLPKATALIYGTLKDDQGNPLAGVDLYADMDQYEGYGLTDSAGNYVVGVTAGTWNIGPDSDGLTALGYSAPGTSVSVTDGEALRQDFTALAVTSSITGTVQESNGNPIKNLDVYAYATINGTNYNANGATDGSGNYSLSVANGTWQVGLNCQGDNSLNSLGLPCVGNQSVTVPSQNQTVNFTVPVPCVGDCTCVVGTGTGASCTEAALNACLPGGGTVTFNCGGTATIAVTSTKTISADTTIDGGSLITISGGNSVRVFGVNNGVNFTVQSLTIANGSNGANGGVGSGIFNNGGTLTVTNSTFSGNSALGYNGAGGGIYNNGGTLTVTSSTFSGNSVGNGSAIGGGGGIFNNGTLTVTNSTFSGNSANGGGGGAIYNNGGTVTVTNSTVSGNSAGSGAAGIFTPGGTVTVTNTIVANSTSGSNCAGSITDGGHNLDSGTTCGFNSSTGSLSNTNPLLDLAGLTNNGGPTQTIALQAGSAAINAGDESVCSAAPVNSLDQRGYVRPGTGAANCSIGAYEFNSPGPPPSCTGDCNGDGQVTVDEILTMVNIALGNTPVTMCEAGDANHDGQITVDEILNAVNNALNGCE